MENNNLTVTWNKNRRKPVSWQMLDVTGKSRKKGRFGRVSGEQMWSAHRYLAFIGTMSSKRK